MSDDTEMDGSVADQQLPSSTEPTRLETHAIAAMRPEAEPADILPGTGSIGRGYNVFGQYCDASSLRARLIDLGQTSDYVSDNVAKMRTSPLVEVTQATSGMARSVTGASARKFSEEFNSAIGLKGSYGYFAGEMNAAYTTTRSRQTTTSFAQYNSELYSYALTLESPTAMRNRLTEAARIDLAEMRPERLFETYGTHYLSRLIVGGRCSYCCTIDTTRYTSSVDMSTAVKVAMDTAIGQGAGSATAEQKKAAEEIQASSDIVVRLAGGDTSLINGILEGEFEAWSKSVADNLAVADLAGGLERISRLIADRDRADEVDAAIDAELARHPMPDAPDVTPVYGYHAPKPPSRWYFTTDPKTAPSGWRNYGTTFSALTEPRDGTVPIWRLSASGPDRFNLSDNHKAIGGWSNAERVFHAWTSPPDDTKTLRIYAYTAKTHEATSGWFYSPKSAISGWTRRHVAFYVPAV